MAKTVTCLFNSESQASSIVRKLEDAGFTQGKICLFSKTGNNRIWDGTSDDASGLSHDRVEDYLSRNGVPHDDARAYAEGVRRGHALVAVRCDDDEVNEVIRIMDNEDALDIDERQAAWRSEGWTGSGAAMAGSGLSGAGMIGTADSATTGATGMMGSSMEDRADMRARTDMSSRSDMTGNRDMSGRDEVIPVAEEELHVGKREVNRGRVRIQSHVVERPVQEQVSLRQEHVEVERRPVEGSMREGAMGSNEDLFRERSIEVKERSEEPVVSKEARVVEEVVVRKDAEQRTETVSDTVRKTEVEVEDERGNAVPRTGTMDDKR